MIVSTQIMKGSEVKYLESDKAYSFHSWAKRSFEPATLACLMTKYPVHFGQSVNKLLGSSTVTRQTWVYTFKEAVERAAFTLALAQKNLPRTRTWPEHSQRINHPRMNLSARFSWELKRVASHSAVKMVMLRRLANLTSSSFRELALGI